MVSVTGYLVRMVSVMMGSTTAWIMPVIGAVMVGAAAGVNVLCLWQWSRSTLNVVATAVTVLATLGAAVILLASSGTDH